MNMCNVKRPLPVLLPCRGFFLGGYPEGGRMLPIFISGSDNLTIQHQQEYGRMSSDIHKQQSGFYG